MATIQIGPLTRDQVRPMLSALTGARYLAALHVVLFHFAGRGRFQGHEWLANIVANGWRAVQFFFILSGFVLAYNYMGERRLVARDFLIARFARVYPVYFLALVWMAPFVIYRELNVASHFGALTKISLSAILSVTMTQAWTPWTAMAWNPVAWSLSAEAFFYAMFPSLTGRFRRAKAPSLVAVALLACILSAVAPLIYELTPHTQTMNRLTHLWLFLHIPVFVLGVALGRLFLLCGPSKYGGIMADAGFAGALVVMAVKPGSLVVTQLALVVLYAITVFGLASGRGVVAWACSRPAMVALGDASYGVYILQIPVAATMIYLMYGIKDFWSVPMASMFGPTWSLTLYIAVITGVSLLSSAQFEVPARRALRRMLSGRPGTTQGA